MNLKEGMYVRTKDGCICKILKETYSKYLSRNKELCYEVDRPINVNMELYNEDVLKASNNIIDLIEIGDYVNGHKVTKVVIDSLCNYVLLEEVGHYVDNPEDIDEKDIKTIVTKEQFENMSYKVKE